ncbi:MAG: 6-phosphofructokinase [Caldiserica bacterium]|nr:MAG: 6-phosphofructokinase [Caldisericota bacterium]
MKRIAVLTSGGDAPGMNAAIRSVVRVGYVRGVEVIGIYRGYRGLLEKDFRQMLPRDVSGILEKGGTVLKTSRTIEFKEEKKQLRAIKNMKKKGIEGLIVIGGNGSQAGSLALLKKGFPTMGIASTIDNDLWGTDYTIGFDTAVNTAIGAIDKIRDTAESHDRTFIVEVMGRDTGFIAVDAGIAGGADIILVPEVKFNINEIVYDIKNGMKKKKMHHLIVCAEGAIHARDLGKIIQERINIDVRVAVLGHIQRGGSPTRFDRLLASTLGEKAVNALLEKEKGKVVGIKDNKIILIPLEQAVTRKKKLNSKLYKLARELSV